VVVNRYNVDVMSAVKFFDENTRMLWTPLTGYFVVVAVSMTLTMAVAEL
jgi:hypothetical protein